MEELMTFLKSEFDYVIIDTPPAYLFSDAAILAGYADRVLYVVRHDMAEIPQIEKGMESFIQEDKLLGYLKSEGIRFLRKIWIWKIRIWKVWLRQIWKVSEICRCERRRYGHGRFLIVEA